MKTTYSYDVVFNDGENSNSKGFAIDLESAMYTLTNTNNGEVTKIENIFDVMSFLNGGNYDRYRDWETDRKSVV